MNTNTKKTPKSWALDVLVMGTVSALVYSFIMYIQPPVPYTDVNVVGVSEVRGGIIVSATFVENDCAFRSMSVYGELDGAQAPVDWNSLDGTSTETIDRKSGKRHMIIKVHTFNSNPDAIVIMTQYDCLPDVQDYRQFAKVDLPIVATP